MEIVLVAAVAENGVIGRDGGLPWRIKSDMQRFRALTWGKPVVVGRKTYLSFTRKPLPGRTNIVVSRDPDFAAPGAIVAASLAAALEVARGDALRRASRRHHGARRRRHLRAGDAPGGSARDHPHPRPAARAIRCFPAIDPAIWREAARAVLRPAPGDDAGYHAVTTSCALRPLAAVRDPAAR